MKRTSFVMGALALLMLLPLKISAQHLYVDPWLDGCNFVWDYGEVEVGNTESMTLRLFVDLAGSVTIYDIVVSESDAFTADYETPLNDTLYPDDPDDPDDDGLDSMEVTVTFSPEAIGLQEFHLRVYSNAINENACSPQYSMSTLEYKFLGTGVDYVQTPAELMADLIEYFDDGVASGTVCGVGPGQAGASHLRVFGRMLDAAADLIDAGDYAAACDELERAALKSDGVRPPDFIDCDGAITVNAMIGEVMDALGCE